MKKQVRRKRSARRAARLGVLLFVCVLLLYFICREFLQDNNFGMMTQGEYITKDQEDISAWNDGSYPKSLIELAEKNPETIPFVKDYPKKKDLREKIRVSGDLGEGIPLFLQWDERWGYRQYGGNFMALTGCGPTCLSMVWCGLTGKGSWNPYKVAKMAEESGYYVEGSGSAWSLMTEGAAALGLQAETVSFDESSIRDTLQQGKPIICVMGPGDFTTQGHFVVLTGVNQAGEILVHDPNSEERSSKSWDLGRLMGQIRNLWAYSVA